MPYLPCGVGGGVGTRPGGGGSTPTSTAQNDPDVALIILTHTFVGGGGVGGKNILWQKIVFRCQHPSFTTPRARHRSPSHGGGGTTTGPDATPPSYLCGGGVGWRVCVGGGGGRLEGFRGVPKVGGGGGCARPTTTTCILLGGMCVWGPPPASAGTRGCGVKNGHVASGLGGRRSGGRRAQSSPPHPPCRTAHCTMAETVRLKCDGW